MEKNAVFSADKGSGDVDVQFAAYAVYALGKPTVEACQQIEVFGVGRTKDERAAETLNVELFQFIACAA